MTPDAQSTRRRPCHRPVPVGERPAVTIYASGSSAALDGRRVAAMMKDRPDVPSAIDVFEEYRKGKASQGRPPDLTVMKRKAAWIPFNQGYYPLDFGCETFAQSFTDPFVPV